MRFRSYNIECCIVHGGGVRETASDNDSFLAIVEVDLETGQHRNPTDNISFFTDAFFHRNVEIRGELEEGGFSIVTQVPIEGMGSMTSDFDSIWAEPHGRKVLLTLLERTEMMEEISGSSFHIMTVGRRGEQPEMH